MNMMRDDGLCLGMPPALADRPPSTRGGVTAGLIAREEASYGSCPAGMLWIQGRTLLRASGDFRLSRPAI